MLVANDQVPCLGVAAQPGHARKAGDEPWQMDFNAQRLVTVVSTQRAAEWTTCRTQSFVRPTSEVSVASLHALKRAFAKYAKSNALYRQAVSRPKFEAERVAALTSPEAATNVLIHHVRMSDEERLALLPLSDADRVERLLTLLST